MNNNFTNKGRLRTLVIGLPLEDYHIEDCAFIIEEYIYHRTLKKVKLAKSLNIPLFEQAITTAWSYFRISYGKTWI